MVLLKKLRMARTRSSCFCTRHSQLALLPLGSKEPIRHFYLLFELFNLCCLFSHSFLKSGDHRIFGAGRGMSLQRNLDLCVMSLSRTEGGIPGFDGLRLIHPTRPRPCW